MTKGHKSGRGTLKPSLVGHKAPAGRVGGESPAAGNQDRGAAGPEIGRDVDCELPDSDLVRNPRAEGAPKSGKLPAGRAHKPRSGPDR